MTANNEQTNLCPVCGRPNHCTLAEAASASAPTAGNKKMDCWCMEAPLSPSARDQLRAQTSGTRCLCQTCLKQFMQQ